MKPHGDLILPTERQLSTLTGRQPIVIAILSYSSSASAPNLDPIAFKEAALARLRNVAVSFESGAVRSTRAVALAACLSSSRMKLRAATLLPAQLLFAAQP